MGNSESTSGEITHEALFKSTASTRLIMNKILEFMMNNVKIQDFMNLSTEAECSKYVLFQANHLYKRFYELQVMPATDKKGTIVFETIKDLGAPSEDNKKKQQSLCLILSYFYTRIFQIYGALALTLVDDIEIIKTSGFMEAMGKEQPSDKLVPRGVRPTYTISGGGPYPKDPLDTFEFLRNYLTDLRYTGDPNNAYRTQYRGSGDSEGLVGFRKRSEPQKGIFVMAYSGSPFLFYLDISSKSKGFGTADTTVNIGSISYTKKDGKTETVALPASVLSQKEITIVSTANQGYMVQLKDGITKNVEEYFNELFSEILKYLKERIKQSGNLTSTSTSEAGVQDELRIHAIIHNLKYRKPLGHCIARGLQLLNAKPLKDQPGISSICKAKFLETTVVTATGTKTTSSRSGIPEPGKSLDTSPGMAALSNLFYDSIAAGNKLEIGKEVGPSGRSSLDQYKEFMTKMATRFGYTTAIKDTTKLSDISNKRDSELCAGKSDNIPVSDARRIYEYVKQLFTIQLQHSAKCGAIFKLLFDYQYDPRTQLTRISLSDNVIKKGIPEIDRINYITRQLLTDYYSNCESTYIQGMGEVLKQTAVKPAVNPEAKPAVNPAVNPAETVVKPVVKPAVKLVRTKPTAPGFAP